MLLLWVQLNKLFKTFNCARCIDGCLSTCIEYSASNVMPHKCSDISNSVNMIAPTPIRVGGWLVVLFFNFTQNTIYNSGTEHIISRGMYIWVLRESFSNSFFLCLHYFITVVRSRDESFSSFSPVPYVLFYVSIAYYFTLMSYMKFKHWCTIATMVCVFYTHLSWLSYVHICTLHKCLSMRQCFTGWIFYR